jgi:hypothetical protein
VPFGDFAVTLIQKLVKVGEMARNLSESSTHAN